MHVHNHQAVQITSSLIYHYKEYFILSVVNNIQKDVLPNCETKIPLRCHQRNFIKCRVKLQKLQPNDKNHIINSQTTFFFQIEDIKVKPISIKSKYQLYLLTLCNYQVIYIAYPFDIPTLSTFLLLYNLQSNNCYNIQWQKQ